MDVSIIIVSWNTKDILHNCLQSVCGQTENIDYEIIVVDNASTDDSVGMVKRQFPQVVLIENSENRGFAAANNQGLALAKGRYVLLLNSDTIILGSSIANTVYFADDHPEAAVIGCRVLNPDKTLQHTCFMYPSLLNMFLESSYLYKIFPQSRFFGREEMAWWDGEDVRKVDVVKGCFMLVRHKAIDQVGVMDERFFMYAEETDWCYRFGKVGWDILYTPGAEIIHLCRASTDQVQGEMLLQLRGSKLIFFRIHKGWVIYAIACLLTALFFFIRVPYWLGMAIFSKTARRRHWQKAGLYTKGAFYSLTASDGLLSKR